MELKMQLTEKQQLILNYILSQTYEQYNIGWCKAQEIVNMTMFQSQGNIDFIENYQKNALSLAHRQDMIAFFLENSLTYHTPESFEFLNMLQSEWILAKKGEHESLLEWIVQKSLFLIEKKKLETQNEILAYLANWNIANLEEYAQISADLKEEIDLPTFYSYQGYTENGQPHLDFTEYEYLKNLFLSGLFDTEKVQFFVNVLPENAEDFAKKGKMPAIIGIDNQVIGLFWLMN
jgi:hypothetical protein